MERRADPADLAAALAAAALVLVLVATVLRGVPAPPTPPRGFDAWLSRHTETVILAWCALTLVHAPGFLSRRRWAIGVGLVVNALYLGASVPGAHLFAIGMHAAFTGYCAWRLFWTRDVSPRASSAS